MNDRVEPPHTVPGSVTHFRILDPLGSGGMGVVYRAHDTKLNRTVALKFLSPDRVRNETARQRLLREARAAAALNHPNIATVYEVGEDRDAMFIAMEYVEGQTLLQRLQGRAQDLHQGLDWAIQITDALAEAHDHGIVHRDIKSTNILITRRNRAKILDFGLALVEPPPGSRHEQARSEPDDESRLTESGTVAGTIQYVAPELFRGEEPSPQSDVFSLGVVLYEIFSGRLPFPGRTALNVMTAILQRPPDPFPSEGLPVGLVNAVRRALSKELAERYATARELLDDLRALQETLQRSGAQPQDTALTPVFPIPNNLPAQLTSFVGRETELKELAELLAANRMLTVSGPGGVGKTRICLELARQSLAGHPDGVFLIELAPLTEDRLLPQAMARELGSERHRAGIWWRPYPSS